MTAVQAFIDERPVLLTDWQADSSVNWGYRTLTGKVPSSVTWAQQGSAIELWASNGQRIWAGKLTLDPVLDKGQLSIRAEGYAADIQARRERMFYRIDGGEQWVDQDAEPHNFATFQGFDTTAGRASLKWAWGNNADVFANGDHAGFILWTEGAEIARYSVALECNPNVSNVDFVTRELTGPAGTSFLIATHALTSDTTFTGNTAVDGSDALWFRAQANAAATPALRRRLKLTSIRVYGRTTDDTFSASEVVSDVAGVVGFDATSVQDNGLAILPLDWTEEHPDLLTYMSEQTDWHWEAFGQEVHFGPWEKVWTGYQSMTVGPTWENLRRYNTVLVPFRYVTGVDGIGEATAADDPFPDEEVAILTDALRDAQPSAALANAMAAAQAPYWASRRVGGRVSIGRVTDEAGNVERLGIRPGHLLDVADREDLEPQRIHGVSLRQNAQTGAIDVTAELNDEFNPIRLLAELQKSRRRRVRRSARRELHA